MIPARKRFNLSYSLESVRWDGKQLHKRPFKAILHEIDCIRQAGVDEIMISSYHMEEPADFDQDVETQKIGKALAERGMKANQHHGHAACLALPGSPQKQVVDNLKRCVDFSANLHADNLVLHLGKLAGRYPDMRGEKAAFDSLLAKHGRDAVIDIVAENMREAADHARSRGVKIALENLDAFHHLSDMEQLPRIVAKAKHPALGYCLDFGHANCAGVSVVDWIKIMGGKLFTTHVHDNHGDPKHLVVKGKLIDATSEFDEHLPPGFGTIPWTDAIIALWEIKYRRTLNFETHLWPCADRVKGYEHAIAFWRAAEEFAWKQSRRMPG